MVCTLMEIRYRDLLQYSILNFCININSKITLNHHKKDRRRGRSVWIPHIPNKSLKYHIYTTLIDATEFEVKKAGASNTRLSLMRKILSAWFPNSCWDTQQDCLCECSSHRRKQPHKNSDQLLKSQMGIRKHKSSTQRQNFASPKESF